MSTFFTTRSSTWAIYGKSIAAALIAVLTAVQAVLSDSATRGRITQVEGVQIAIAVANASLIWLVPNMPQWPWMKTALAAVLAALQLSTGLILDGISSADVSALIIAALMIVAPAAAPALSLRTAPPADPDPAVYARDA